MSNDRKRVLVVGASSKIAQLFIKDCPPNYEVYGTYRSTLITALPTDRQFKVDLGKPTEINDFLQQISHISFDAVLLFAASYNPDPEEPSDYFDVFMKSLQLNGAGLVAIAKGLHFEPGSKLFLFGDAGLNHPKKNFTSYSMAKYTVAEATKLLAVELAPATACVCIQLGPTLRPASKPAGTYYDKGLLKVEEPAIGLVHLLHFLIVENNFNATGCIIDYDGGAYLRRL